MAYKSLLQITDVGHEKKMDLHDFVMLPNRWENISQTAHLVSGDRNFIRKTFPVSKNLGFKLWVQSLALATLAVKPRN